MELKNGVSLLGLHPMMIIACCEAAVIWSDYGEAFVITEGVCYRTSGFHPLGRACDYRVNMMSPGRQQAVTAQLRNKLGSDYDVILHGEGDSIHVHCEFDPTNPKII